MTLSEYAARVNQLLTRNPEWRDLPVFFASDSEGNQYFPVVFHAAGAQMDDPTSAQPDCLGMYDPQKKEVKKEAVNAIVIN